MPNIAINGFGRIGRVTARLLEDRTDIELVAVNDLTDGAMLAHLLEWDSVYGRLKRDISFENGELRVDDRRIRVFDGWQRFDVELTPMGNRLKVLGFAGI